MVRPMKEDHKDSFTRSTVISRDGTKIGYQSIGRGPGLMTAGGAGGAGRKGRNIQFSRNAKILMQYKRLREPAIFSATAMGDLRHWRLL